MLQFSAYLQWVDPGIAGNDDSWVVGARLYMALWIRKYVTVNTDSR